MLFWGIAFFVLFLEALVMQLDTPSSDFSEILSSTEIPTVVKESC